MTTTPDPRGPYRTATKIHNTPEAALVTLSCGHVANFVTHFSYKIGDEHRCHACGQAERARQQVEAEYAEATQEHDQAWAWRRLANDAFLRDNPTITEAQWQMAQDAVNAATTRFDAAFSAMEHLPEPEDAATPNPQPQLL